MKIISGGQTGVDQATLDAALEADIEVGGYCPAERVCDIGRIPDYYPLLEIKNGRAIDRTRKNIQASDGTIIIHYGLITGGSLQTLCYCVYSSKPFVLVDAEKLSVPEAVDQLIQFVETWDIFVLNVAGPKASDHEQAYGYTLQIMQQFCQQIKNHL